MYKRQHFIVCAVLAMLGNESQPFFDVYVKAISCQKLYIGRTDGGFRERWVQAAVSESREPAVKHK